MARSNRAIARLLATLERRKNFADLAIHERMLADTVRLNAYREAISRYVRSGDCVVDLGTGSGVLASFASLRRPRKLYAIDHSPEMLRYAAAAAQANNIENVNFVASSSYGFDPPEQLDLILQEQMGVALFDEGMVAALIDLRDRCLSPRGRILPAKFEFYLEPVQLLGAARIPFVQELLIPGLKFPPPPSSPRPEYYFREINDREVDFLLCQPKPAFTFDLGTITLEQLPRRFNILKPIQKSGQLDGICVYFKAIFDDEITFCTGPRSAKTHWPMLLYRAAAQSCRADDDFELRVDAPELSDYLNWSWQIGILQK
jgi:protein arginine N-methyltransferase 1